MITPATAAAPSEILIAEDSLTQALRLQAILEKRGYRVTSARNGRIALDALVKLRPAAIISDIQMPEMDGYELCRRIKADSQFDAIPVILLTTLSAPQDIIHGLECGADNFVVKPYDDDFLLSRLDAALANRDAGGTNATGGIPVHFAGKRYVITSSRRQILHLLLSTYETAVKTNDSLIAAQEDLKAAQDQLIEAEKLQSVGRLAAGVAHEVKNPLAIIEMAVDLLETQPDAETVGMLVGEMKESVRRANKVITGLMDLSIADESGMKETSLGTLIERVLAALESEIVRSKVSVSTDCAPSLPLCRIDVSKIEQAFSNVIANALQEMPGGGKLDISAFAKILSPADVSFESGDRTGARFRAGDTAVIVTVRDTGGGILPENLHKVFEPFFSTKPTGKGIGLGLTVARKFMELHGGRITLANAGQGGAEATLFFKPV
ncbi:MAG: response regulator [Chthoniobacteraceae bacterium]